MLQLRSCGFRSVAYPNSDPFRECGIHHLQERLGHNISMIVKRQTTPSRKSCGDALRENTAGFINVWECTCVRASFNRCQVRLTRGEKRRPRAMIMRPAVRLAPPDLCADFDFRLSAEVWWRFPLNEKRVGNNPVQVSGLPTNLSYCFLLYFDK